MFAFPHKLGNMPRKRNQPWINRSTKNENADLNLDYVYYKTR